MAPTCGGSARRARRARSAFREKFELPFTLLADEAHDAAEAYGSWVEKKNYGKTYMGTARRTFLVDPDGRIAKTWEKVKPEGHAADVLGVARHPPGDAGRVSEPGASPSRAPKRLRSWGETSEASAGRVPLARTPRKTVMQVRRARRTPIGTAEAGPT